MDNSWLFVLTIVPLIIYVVVDSFMGLKKGIISAFVVGTISTLGLFMMIGEIDWEAVSVIVLLGATGFISIKKDDPLFFKLQPMITGIFSTLVLAYFQFLDTPLFVKYLPKIEHLLDPRVQAVIGEPEFIAQMVRINLYVMIWVFVHALIMGIAAKKWSNKVWITAKALGLPFVAIMSWITGVLHSIASA